MQNTPTAMAMAKPVNNSAISLACPSSIKVMPLGKFCSMLSSLTCLTTSPSSAADCTVILTVRFRSKRSIWAAPVLNLISATSDTFTEPKLLILLGMYKFFKAPSLCRTSSDNRTTMGI